MYHLVDKNNPWMEVLHNALWQRRHNTHPFWQRGKMQLEREQKQCCIMKTQQLSTFSKFPGENILNHKQTKTNLCTKCKENIRKSCIDPPPPFGNGKCLKLVLKPSNRIKKRAQVFFLARDMIVIRIHFTSLVTLEQQILFALIGATDQSLQNSECCEMLPLWSLPIQHHDLRGQRWSSWFVQMELEQEKIRLIAQSNAGVTVVEFWWPD